MPRKKLLLVTPGDPDGIGPEVTWKSIQACTRDPKLRDCQLICVGAAAPFERAGKKLRFIDPSADLRDAAASGRGIPIIAAPTRAPERRFLPGFQAGWSIETAVRLVLEGKADAIVTGPISKERLQRGGFPFPGHTEMLAKLCGVPEVTMMLANNQLRISLATTHIGIRDVPNQLDRERIRRAILHTADHLTRRCGIRRPRIAVAALNPHAGESGLFGKEEIRVIAPELAALKRARGRSMELIGPLPADTLFAKHINAKPKTRFDAVVCMYHDQGLIPVKLLDFPRTVNITLGLPIVRTSVDHGTGFDIAGKGIADPSSMLSAIRMALQSLKPKGILK